MDAPLREAAVTFLADHAPELGWAAVAFLAGRLFGRLRAAKEWRRREFPDVLMFSLTSIVEDEEGVSTLAIRTLIEQDLARVVGNRAAVGTLLKAAQRTTGADPIVPLEGDDRWHVHNAIVNEVARRFSMGSLARDLGLPVVARRYLVALTREVHDAVKTRKLRALVVRKDLLVSGAFAAPLRLERESHAVRLETLRRLRAAYADDPNRFVEVELCQAAAAALTPSAPSGSPRAPRPATPSPR